MSRNRKKSPEQRERIIAHRLRVSPKLVREHNIEPSQVDELLADPPQWLLDERERQARKRERRRARQDSGDPRKALSDELVSQVHDVWFQELKRTNTEEEVAEIDARWAPEVERAKREARQLADELTPEQMRARIDRERDAARTAGVYRAKRIAERARSREDG